MKFTSKQESKKYTLKKKGDMKAKEAIQNLAVKELAQQ